MLYYSLFQSHLIYGILAWGHKLGENDFITKKQKKCVRIINQSGFNAHTTPIFKSLKIVKAKDVYTCNKYTFLYKLQNKSLPQYFTNNFVFTMNHDLHGHNTRRNRARLPTMNTNKKLAKISLKLAITNLLNDGEVKIITKIHTHSYDGYKNYSKNHFIELYHESCSVHKCYICSK